MLGVCICMRGGTPSAAGAAFPPRAGHCVGPGASSPPPEAAECLGDALGQLVDLIVDGLQLMPVGISRTVLVPV